MTVLEVMATLRRDERRLPVSVKPSSASAEAIRLALQLRDVAARAGGRVVLFVPASRLADASHAAGDAARGLLELRDGPVLMMDLRDNADSAATGGWINALTADDELQVVWGGAAASNVAAVLRPMAGQLSKLQYASSAEFVSTVDDVRARYPYVLCIGDSALGSVPTLMMAGLADAVVLSVLAGQTTKSEMQEVTAELRRAHAKLLGFVVDPRGTQRKAER